MTACFSQLLLIPHLKEVHNWCNKCYESSECHKVKIFEIRVNLNHIRQINATYTTGTKLVAGLEAYVIFKQNFMFIRLSCIGKSKYDKNRRILYNFNFIEPHKNQFKIFISIRTQRIISIFQKYDIIWSFNKKKILHVRVGLDYWKPD